MAEHPHAPDGGRVRDEDAFDVGRADAWLKGRVAGLDGIPEVRQFSGSASDLTYLLPYPGRDLILRRPPREPAPSRRERRRMLTHR